MKQKNQSKSYSSSIALYEKLKNALKAQKNYTQPSQQKKSEAQSSQLTFSKSLNLNQMLLNCQSPKKDFSLINKLQKSPVAETTPMTPYQERKKTQKDIQQKIQERKKKKVPYFQVFKGKNHHLLSVKQTRQKRLNNFFSSKQKNKKQAQQDEHNLTYSIVLKSLNQDQQNQQQKNKEKNVNNFENLSSVKYQRFYDSSIQNNVKQIQNIKKHLSESVEENLTMIRHFPELQILNQNYFTESKKNLFKRINSTNAFCAINGHKALIITSKHVDLSNHQCKRLYQKQNLALMSKEQEQKRKNFEYFVYEYKTLGNRDTKISKNSVSPSSSYKPYRQRPTLQSATFLRSKQSFFHKQVPHSTKSDNLTSQNMFHNFIYKNKKAACQSVQRLPTNRKRSMTANIKSRQRYDLRGANGNGWKSVAMKGQTFKGMDQNFVKPWQNMGQGQVGF